MNNLLSVLTSKWIPYAAIITLLCGIIYTVVQQNYRHNANDLQYQMAEDAAYSLSNGADPKSLITVTPVELSHSLSPYLIIYDENENAVASGALLNGKVPKMPSGVLDYVKKNGEDMISWQPQRGIREALVIKKSEGNRLYFIAAGRSLRKVEERIGMLMQHVVFGWVSSLIILFIIAWSQKRLETIK